MEDLTQIPQWTLHLFGLNLVFNTGTILMTWIVMGGLILFGFLASSIATVYVMIRYWRDGVPKDPTLDGEKEQFE